MDTAAPAAPLVPPARLELEVRARMCARGIPDLVSVLTLAGLTRSRKVAKRRLEAGDVYLDGLTAMGSTVLELRGRYDVEIRRRGQVSAAATVTVR